MTSTRTPRCPCLRHQLTDQLPHPVKLSLDLLQLERDRPELLGPTFELGDRLAENLAGEI